MTWERRPVERLAAAVRGRLRLLWGGVAALSLLTLLLGGGGAAKADTTTVTVQVPVTRYEYRQTGSHQEQRLAGGRWEWQRTLDNLRPPWASYGMGNAWLVGDLNGDGRLDAVHLCCSDYLRAWVQQADGSFSVGPTQRPWSGYPMQGGVWEVADWNGDGRQDLRHYVNGRRYDWRSLGNGSFQVTDGGALPAPNVAMSVDSPAGGSRVSQALWINGWALDRSAPGGAGCGIDDVHVWAYPSDSSGNPTGSPVFLGAAVLGRDRADVASAYGQQFGYCGFDLRAGGLGEGYWLIIVYAHSALSAGGPWAEQRRVVWVKGASWASDSWNHPGGIRLWVDRPTRGSMIDQPFPVEGWALDLASCCNAGIDYVHVWAYPAKEDGMPNGDPPVFVGAAQLGLYRPDVGNVYGRQYDSSGFSLNATGLPGGYWRLIVYARSAISGQVIEQHRLVYVPPMAMYVDMPAWGQMVKQPFQVAGWALDQAAASSPAIDYVHVWAYPSDRNGNPTGSPVFLGAAQLGLSRPDVGNVYGRQYDSAGFSLSASGFPTGHWRLIVYARSAISGQVSEQHRLVYVPPMAMYVDVPSWGSQVRQPFQVAGWALDQAAASGVGIEYVHVWAYPARADGVVTGPPQFVGAAQLGGSRPDVGAVYGPQFNSAGFNLNGGNVPGTGYWLLIVYAKSAISGQVMEQHRLVYVTW